MKKIIFKIILFILILVFVVFIGNKVFAKYICETAKILIMETDLDRTPPKLNISYSTTDLTNENIVVTINSNEKIKPVDGWSLSEDGLSITKTYTSNILEEIYVYDIAGNKSKADININNIDKIIPAIQCTSITNSNSEYSSYANSSKIINCTIKLTDNISLKSTNLSKCSIKVGNEIINPIINWNKISETDKEIIYDMEIKNITGEGNLSLIFDVGFLTDTANNINMKTEIDTNITIDNTKPVINYSQEIISNGKVKAMLNSNEAVRKINGWNITQDLKQLNKEFTSNVSYEITVTDLAGNETVTIINITDAKYINLVYASHNSNIGWTYGYGNYDIAGKNSVLKNPIYKTEALAFNITGNIDNDFFMARAYVHSYWGNGSIGKCSDSGMLYNYGYNPNIGSWKTMNSTDLVTINNQKYIQFGGSGINKAFNTDVNGNNPIPVEISEQFNFGISGIALALKDYTEYSIVYQIYISEYGWLEAVSNGEETMLNEKKPMSAFRVALLPSSEKENQLNTWNKDIGKKIL